MTRLPMPEVGRESAESFVGQHLAHLLCDEPASRSPFAGGQTAADAALGAFDVAGYASGRNQVWPTSDRGASRLSPYIRHGLLALPTVWEHVGGGPADDVAKFRDELLWQEYARHLYARLGTRTAAPLRARLAEREYPVALDVAWQSQLDCVSANVDELIETGWLVNQARMWLSSHWTVRHHRPWNDGEDFFFRHLLDGSRAANRLGWQWTTGTGSHKAYGFNQWQVEKRAPGLCETCSLVDRCPIRTKPTEPDRSNLAKPTTLAADRETAETAGPSSPTVMMGPEVAAVDNNVAEGQSPDVVWLTAESLGLSDPALVAHSELTAVFVFDEPLLDRLRLSAKRLVFLTETLAELAARRPLEIYLGDPVAVVGGRRPAVTFAPVPGFRSRLALLPWVLAHPWPWLTRPHAGSLQSFTAWRKAAGTV